MVSFFNFFTWQVIFFSSLGRFLVSFFFIFFCIALHCHLREARVFDSKLQTDITKRKTNKHSNSTKTELNIDKKGGNAGLPQATVRVRSADLISCRIWLGCILRSWWLEDALVPLFRFQATYIRRTAFTFLTFLSFDTTGRFRQPSMFRCCSGTCTIPSAQALALVETSRAKGHWRILWFNNGMICGRFSGVGCAPFSSSTVSCGC